MAGAGLWQWETGGKSVDVERGQVVEPWVAADPTQKYREVLRLLLFSAG